MRMYIPTRKRSVQWFCCWELSWEGTWPEHCHGGPQTSEPITQAKYSHTNHVQITWIKVWIVCRSHENGYRSCKGHMTMDTNHVQVTWISILISILMWPAHDWYNLCAGHMTMVTNCVQVTWHRIPAQAAKENPPTARQEDPPISSLQKPSHSHLGSHCPAGEGKPAQWIVGTSCPVYMTIPISASSWTPLIPPLGYLLYCLPVVLGRDRSQSSLTGCSTELLECSGGHSAEGDTAQHGI